MGRATEVTANVVQSRQPVLSRESTLAEELSWIRRKPAERSPVRRGWATAKVIYVVAALILLTVLVIELVMFVVSYAHSGLFSHIGMDFLSTYTAAGLLGHGESHHLYSDWSQGLAQAPLLAQYHVHWTDRVVQPFVAPPLLAAIALPLRALSAGKALLLWEVVSTALFVATGWLLDRTLGLGLGRLAPFLVLGFLPVYATLFLGQTEAILLAGFAAFTILLLRGHDLPAGLALSLLLLKPPLLLAPVVYLLVKHRWRTLAALASAAGVSTLTSIGILGASGTLAYLHLGQELSQPAGTVATNVLGMINIRGAVVRLLPGAPPLAVQFVIVSLTLVVLAGAIALWRRGDGKRESASEMAGMALLSVTTVLVSYHTLVHSGALLIVAFALLWKVVRTLPEGSRERHLFLILTALSWLIPTLAFIPDSTYRLPAVAFMPLISALWFLSAECQLRTTQPAPALATIVDLPHPQPSPVKARGDKLTT